MECGWVAEWVGGSPSFHVVVGASEVWVWEDEARDPTTLEQQRVNHHVRVANGGRFNSHSERQVMQVNFCDFDVVPRSTTTSIQAL